MSAAAHTTASAAHAPRDFEVGTPTVLAIYAQRLMPGRLDRYLALSGYDSQSLDERVDTARPDNLLTAVGWDHGAHGCFDAHARSWQLTARTAIADIAGSAVGLARPVVGPESSEPRLEGEQR